MGLVAPSNPPPNSLIAFSTSLGSVAADGEGTHSPYTRALLRYVGRAGQNMDELFTNVRKDVKGNTAGIQVPWENTSLDAGSTNCHSGHMSTSIAAPSPAIRTRISKGVSVSLSFL